MKMTLGVKIGAGFGALILIAAALGGLAIFRMQYISGYAHLLDEEYVPEVNLAVGLERTALQTMYEMRGYGYTEDPAYLKTGRENLARVNELLQETQKLADRATSLKLLQGHIADIRGAVNDYTKLVDETVAVNERLGRNRSGLDQAARDFVTTINEYLADQTQKLAGQIRGQAAPDRLLERADKITWANDVIDLGNEIRIAVWRAQAQRDPEVIQGVMPNFDKITNIINQQIIPKTTDAQDIRRLEQIQNAAATYRKNSDELVANWLQLQEIDRQRGQTGVRVVNESHETAEAGLEATAGIAEETYVALENASWVMAVGLLAALLLGVVIALFITRSITGPIAKAVTMLVEMGKGRLNNRLKMERDDEIGTMARTMDEFADTLQNQVVAALEKLAVGDLTSEVKPHDEQDVIGNSLLKTHDDLNRIVAEILAATEQIAAGSSQVSSSSQSLSQGATESAASLEEITSSMTEMASQTKLNAENSTQANQLAAEARKAAETGNEQMEKMMAAMGEINQAGQNISKIIKVIDEIAFQTNLLALNAAVEAARAGRHGKGFAVVAEEVRNLAARSAKAAKETAELIEGSVKKTENGTEIAAQTATSLQAIVTSITKATDLVGEIAAASNEQAQGISQVNEGLSQIDQVTQTNTANAEEGAAAAEELSSQADHLRGLMSTFTVKGDERGRRQQRALPAAGPSGKGGRGGSAATSGQFRGWDDEGPTPSKKSRPSEIIALDDREFGKY